MGEGEQSVAAELITPNMVASIASAAAIAAAKCEAQSTGKWCGHDCSLSGSTQGSLPLDEHPRLRWFIDALYREQEIALANILAACGTPDAADLATYERVTRVLEGREEDDPHYAPALSEEQDRGR